MVDSTFALTIEALRLLWPTQGHTSGLRRESRVTAPFTGCYSWQVLCRARTCFIPMNLHSYLKYEKGLFN